MTIGELKKLIENAEYFGYIADDFEIDIMGEHSGSFGTILVLFWYYFGTILVLFWYYFKD